MKQHKAIILAAGLGSRLRPMTNDIPKGMVLVSGMPIIQHQIIAYKQAGLRNEDIFICVGYKHEVINKFIKTEYPGIQIVENLDFDITNNMFSLYLALKDVLVKEPSALFISNGDCVYDPVIISRLANAAGSFITSDKGSYLEESMKVIVANGVVKQISKQITEQDAYGNSIDLYRFEKPAYEKLFATIKNTIEEEKKLNLWTEVAIDQIFAKTEVAPFDIGGAPWMEIDNYDDLAVADVLFSNLDIKKKHCLCFDLDGTIHLGGKPLPEAVDFIKTHQDRYKYFFMTNNTSVSKKEHLKKLISLGLPVNEEDVLTPYEALEVYLKEHELNKVYLCVPAAAKKDFFSANPTLKESSISECEVIVLGYDTEFDYAKMKEISIELQKRNVKYFATHSDIFCPTTQGNVPDIGAFIKLIEMTTGKEPEIIFGKPNKFFLSQILARYPAKDVLVIGDRLYTDKKLADECGVDFALVLTGETKRSDLSADNAPFPSIVLKDFSYLEKHLSNG